ncbi:MAG TPA: hypothetical protein VFQ80_08285, partial [Thermomicrobiales bacterium]|nr:hypothetical protein [Thermomicrobiales bacterium]
NGQCCAADEYCNDGDCEYCPSGKTCSDSCCFHSTDVCCNGGCWPVEGAPYAACAGNGICCPRGYHCCDEGLSGCCADQ